MNWFQRYGIPGASFWGFLLLWIWCLYDHTFTTEGLQAMLAVAVVFFLPIGFFLSICHQVFYLWLGLGTDSKAMKQSKVFLEDNIPDREYKCEVETLLWLQQNSSKQPCADKAKTFLEQGEWIWKWSQKRSDVMAISGGVIWAVAAAILTSFIIWPWAGWCLQTDGRVLLVLLLSGCVVSVCWWIYHIMHAQSVLVFKRLYEYFDKQKTSKPGSEAIEEKANGNKS